MHREITVPNTGSEDFARTVDVFTNPTASPITTTVRIVGNLGSDAATTVFNTSDGDNLVEPTDQWIGTDDADGSGTPAIIHYIHGSAGMVPADVQVVGDNVFWEYNLTVAPGETVRLAHFTIVADTRAQAEASANALVTSSGFGGEAAAFLTPAELASLANFTFGSLTATLTGGNLTVADIDATGKDNDLTVRLVNGGADLEISDANEQFQSAPAGGTLSNGNKTLTIANYTSVITAGLTFNTLGGNDTLTVDHSGGDAIPAGNITFHGGNPTSGSGDQLIITGGSQGTVTYNHTNANDGSVVSSVYGTIHYTGLEPITNFAAASDIVFNLPATMNVVTLGDDGTGSNGLSKLSGATFEDTTFANPTGSITINGGSGTDTITIDSLPDFNASLIIDGMGGTDSIVLAGAITLGSATSSGNLALTAETIALNANINTDASSTGTHGTVTLAATTGITLGANITLDTDGTGIDGAATFAGNLNGAHSMIVRAGSADVSLQSVGNVTPLTSMGFNANVVTLHGSTVSATGVINLLTSAGATLASNVTLTGSFVGGYFNADLATNARILSINGSFQGSVGLVQAVQSFTVTGSSASLSGVQTRDGGVNIAVGTLESNADIRTDAGTNAGNISLTASSNLSLQDDIVLDSDHASGTDGSITINGTANSNIVGSNRLLDIYAGGGDVSLNGALGNLRPLGVLTIHTADEVSLAAVTTADAGVNVTGRTISLTGSLNTGGGNVTLTALDGVTLTGAAADVTTTILTVNADSDNDGSGTYAQADAGSAVNVSSASITAADVTLAGTINAGAGLVSVVPTNSRQIDLGTDTAGKLGLTDAELDLITAATLQIGTAFSGAISVTAAITSNTNLSLTSGAGGILSTGGSLATSGSSISLNTAGPIGTSGNRIGFADNTNTAQQVVTVGSTHQPSSVFLAGLGTLTLDTVLAQGPVNVTAQDGLVTQGINAGSGTITLAANQDNSATQGFTQGAGTTIQTTDSSSAAVSITVNTSASTLGTGPAALQNVTAGAGAGTVVTVNANSGNVTQGSGTALTAVTGTVSLTGSSTTLSGNPIGTPASPVRTTAANVLFAARGVAWHGDSHITETDGATFSGTGGGDFGSHLTLRNLSGTLVVGGSGIATSNGVSFGSGAVTLSSADGVTIDAPINVPNDGLSITVNANTAGTDAAGFVMTAGGTITNLSSTGVTITVNSAAGGTGGAQLHQLSVANGGSISIRTDNGGNTTGGSITRIPGAQVVAFIGSVTLRTGASNAAIGTPAEPLRTFTNNLFVSTGSGGAFIHQGIAFNLNELTVTGAGNSTIVSDGTNSLAGPVSMGTGLLTLSPSMGGVVLTGGTTNVANGSLDINSDFTLTAGTLIAPTSDSFTVSGNWSRTGSAFTPGAGTVTFDGTSGTQTLNAGGAAFNNVTHGGAATLQLVTSNLTAAGSLTNSAGTLDIGSRRATVGSFALSGGTLSLAVNSPYTTGGTDFGQIVASGAVTLTGGSLVLTGGAAAPSNNNPLTIIDKLAAGVTAPFNGQPESTDVTANNFTRTLSYVGGDGNDVVLLAYVNDPIAAFTAVPNPAAPAQSITFDGSTSFHQHPGHNIVSYQWEFGDSNTASGVTATHSYTQFGTYTATLTVTDDNVPPRTAMTTVTVNINQGNLAPAADAGGPYIVDFGSSVTLDGSASSDPNAAAGDSIVSYQWDIDNDGQFDDAVGVMPLVPWSALQSLPQPGVANTVRLRVTDTFGLSNIDTTSLTIYVNQPTAAFTATPNPAAPGQSITFDGSGSLHQHPGRSIVSYQWDFDYDGTTFDIDTTGVVVTHSYLTGGTPTVALRVIDDNVPPRQHLATTVVTILATDLPPTAADDTFTGIQINSSNNALDVLANDSTAPNVGEVLTITAVSAPSGGGSVTVTGSPGSQSISYTPFAGFVGTETFTYTINDGTPGSDDTATVTVAVTPVFIDGNDLVVVGDSNGNRIILSEPLGFGNGIMIRYDHQNFGPYFPTGVVRVDGNGGNDTIVVSPPFGLNLVADGGLGNDYLAGSDRHDTLIGGAGNDVILSGEGNNLLIGDDRAGLVTGGTDRLESRSGRDTLFGGDGNDRLNAGAGNDTVDGGNGNDALFGDLGNDLLFGRSGFDTINGYYGNDIVLGGDGADQLFGGNDHDLLIGNAGNDRVRGDAGDDAVIGGHTALDATITAALDALLASNTPFGTGLQSALDAWFTSLNRTGFGSLSHDGDIDELTGGTGSDQFQAEAVDILHGFRAIDGDTNI